MVSNGVKHTGRTDFERSISLQGVAHNDAETQINEETSTSTSTSATTTMFMQANGGPPTPAPAPRGPGQPPFLRAATLQDVLCEQQEQDRGDKMHIEEFQFWFDAIEQDNSQAVEEILRNCNQIQRRLFIDGRFVFNIPKDSLKSADKTRLPCAFERPLVLAAVFRSKEILKIFLRDNGDVFIQDINASTVLHGIIWAVALNPSLEPDYFGIYELLINNLTKDQKKHLIFLEDSEGLRPLELATRLCTFGLFQKIIDTEGVYLYNKGHLGGYICTWFDVTEYENSVHGQRCDRSPLKMLVALEKEHLKNAQSSKVLQHPAIDKWIQTKIVTNVPYIVAWFLTRIAYTVLIFIGSTADDIAFETHFPHVGNAHAVPPGRDTVHETRRVNETFCPSPLFDVSEITHDYLTALVIGFSILIVLFDLMDNLLHHTKFRRRDARLYHVFGSRNFVVRTRFYRVCNFLLAASVLVFYTARFFRTSAIMSKAYMLTNILNIWSLLFFIQLLPALGYFVTIIQRMLKDMFHFLVLYVILFFSFSQTFYNLFYMGEVCTEEFHTVPMSMYSTFRVMLNMIDLTNYRGADMTDVAILHISYVIVVPILLVNFLIALMSNSVSDVAENRYNIMTLQRLSAALLVEERLARFISSVYKYQQKTLLVLKEGRVYVECFIMKKSNMQ